ncbi:MAG: LLM class flavin-dependent oxidoreductase [Chloroflexi bacterium]|nr:LLM class flavin-dependent oxidoreductase [Chloroflexota bacterium]
MKFGMMYEIQIPEPHYPGIERDRYHQLMAQVELGDQVGFDYFWTVEHHFLNEFSHCSAPEVLYGAISQRTKRIRIGHAVALLPEQYTTRCGSRNGRRCWTSSATGAWTWEPAGRRP